MTVTIAWWTGVAAGTLATMIIMTLDRRKKKRNNPKCTCKD